jgi:hypothetical protein
MPGRPGILALTNACRDSECAPNEIKPRLLLESLLDRGYWPALVPTRVECPHE